MAAAASLLPKWESGFAQEAKGLPPLNRFPRMMQEYFVRRLREAEAARMERLERLQTKADAEAYVNEVREKVRLSFGPFPEKTPLNARSTRVIERDGYRIENVVFESRPWLLCDRQPVRSQ